MTEGALVSVIIPTLNSSGTIEKTLESVENQTWKNLEIIVVDNLSKDDTVELASAHPSVKVYSHGPERSGQINFGVRQSRGEFIYRIDSDFILEPHVIEEAMSVCSAGADAVLIHNTSDPSISFWARVRKLERDSLVDDWEHVAARFVRRNAFDAIGGFDERLYAEEDRDFHERLVAACFKIGRIKSSETHMGEPLALAEVVRKHVYYGESIRQYIRLKGTRAGLRLGPFRRAFLRHWRDIVSDPTLLLGFFLYQYVRYASSLAGLLVNRRSSGDGGEVPLEETGSRGGVSVVIVTRERPVDLERCLRSLEQASAGKITEVVVVDDASKMPPLLPESTLQYRVLRNAKRSYLATSRNRGARDTTGRYIMFVDDDNILESKSITTLCSVLDNDGLAMVASPAICYTSQPKRVWFAGGWIAPVSGIFVAAFRGIDSDRLPSAPYYTETFHDAFMIRREAFKQVGYFDEVNFPMYLSEADLAARLKEAGFRALVVPAARVWHSITPLEGASSLLRGVHITEPIRAYFVGRNRLLYMRRHSNLISFLAHAAIFEPVIVSIHLFAILSGHSNVPWTRLFGPYLRGVLDGLSGRVRMGRRLIEMSN